MTEPVKWGAPGRGAGMTKFGFFCACLALGLLLWARLIVVADVPKMAIADDPGQAPGVESPDAENPSDKPARTVPVVVDAQPVRNPFAATRSSRASAAAEFVAEDLEAEKSSRQVTEDRD